MATTTKLTGAGGFYGYTGYSNSAANHLYIGKQSSTYNYRSRVAFPSMRTVAGADSRILITSIKLYLRRNGEGATAVTAGCSASGQWGADADATATGTVGSTSGWYAIDCTSMAEAVAGYGGTWYIHMTGASPRVRCSGTGSDYKPYLSVTWEYMASTISGDADEVTLGDTVTYTVTPEAEGELHDLTWALGSASGTIATGAGNTIAWTPPVLLAAELPDSETGMAAVRMVTKDADGNVLRNELYYQTVRVPEDVKPSCALAVRVLDGLQGKYGLTGRSHAEYVPTVDMTAAQGASIARVAAELTDGGAVRTIEWTAMTETDAGIFTGAAADGGVFTSAGSAVAVLTVTDSRGRTATAEAAVEVYAYSPPVISEFTAERYEPVYDENEEITGYQASDLGGYVWVTLRAGVTDVRVDGSALNALSWTITAKNGSAVQTVSGSGGQAVALVNDRAMFPAAVGEDETWSFTATVTDTAGGSAAQYDDVIPGRANLSLSPDGYGVAAGMIAAGRRYDPRFEVAKGYAGHFYGGLYGADGYRVDMAMKRYSVPDGDIAGGFAPYAEEWRPTVARAGALVMLTGIMKASEDTSGASASHTLFTLPEWARPVTDVHAVMQGSGTNLFWLRITADGAVTVQRYRNTSSNAAIPAGAQLTMHAVWIAADGFCQLYAVTKALSHARLDNPLSEIAAGRSYLALVTAEDGYVLSAAECRNLYAGARDFSGAWNNLVSWTADGAYGSFSVRTRKTAWNGLSRTVAVQAGETYTLSAYMKAASGADVRFICKDGSSAILSGANNAKIAVGTDWARYSVTFTISTAGQMLARFENAKAVSLSVCGLMLEAGDAATDWTPAAEDLAGKGIQVTMGGADVTESAVNGREIRIGSVDGDIAVTVTAG